MRRIQYFVSGPKTKLLCLMLATGLTSCVHPPPKQPVSSTTPISTPSLAAVTNSGANQAQPRPVWSGDGNLREYYLRGKYPQEEIDAVARLMEKLYPEREQSQRSQMMAEILSFHHVVFHPTEYHDLQRNHKLIRSHSELLKSICERHNVPFLPVLAITSWENSGGTNKVSWADAAGLGQMTWGAVDEAHRYASRKAAQLKEQAQWEKYQGDRDHDTARLAKAQELYALASRLNVEQRHRQMAKEAGVKDERQIPECNLEDVVLFFDYLLSQYGGRVDHAIAAYHKGVLNQDDILYDYIRRRDSSVLYPQPADRTSFLEALERLNVTYLDLWNDPRSREMLNGMRTVEGEKTTRQNKHLALGDESDIYPWKVMGSLAAFMAGDDYLARTVERYSVPQLAGEVRGLPAFAGVEGQKEGSDKGYLVKLPPDYWKTDNEGQLWVRPELAGYLAHLRDRMRRLMGSQKWNLPIVALGESAPDKPGWESELHQKGVAVRLTTSGMTIEQRNVLRDQLQQDYLFDRIYLRSNREEHHLVINPRFGHEFMKFYETKFGSIRKSD